MMEKIVATVLPANGSIIDKHGVMVQLLGHADASDNSKGRRVTEALTRWKKAGLVEHVRRNQRRRPIKK